MIRYDSYHIKSSSVGPVHVLCFVYPDGKRGASVLSEMSMIVESYSFRQEDLATLVNAPYDTEISVVGKDS